MSSPVDISTAAVQDLLRFGANGHVDCACYVCRMRRTLLALAQRRDELEQAQTWRDIATAPKDGRMILAYAKKWDQPGAVVWTDQGRWWGHDYGFVGDDELPTHWAPIPEPPK